MKIQLLESMQHELKYKSFISTHLKSELNDRISNGYPIDQINEIAILIKENNEAYDILSDYIKRYKEECLKLDNEKDINKLNQIKVEIDRIEEEYRFKFIPETLS